MYGRKAEKLCFLASIALICSMFTMSIYALIYEWEMGIASLFYTVLSILPVTIFNRFGLPVPWAFELIIAIPIFFHIGGGVLGLYTIYWFDDLLHIYASGLISFSTIIVLYLLAKYTGSFFKATTWVMVFLAIMVTLAIGALWEIAEFASDQTLATTEQGSNYDTMTDLIYNIIGGSAVAIASGALIKGGKFEKIIPSLDDGANRIAVRAKR
jgi:hypothetical protein